MFLRKLRVWANSIQVSSRISQNFLMGVGVSDFVSVGHIYARARILSCQSQCLSESRIYHSPPQILYNWGQSVQPLLWAKLVHFKPGYGLCKQKIKQMVKFNLQFFFQVFPFFSHKEQAARLVSSFQLCIFYSDLLPISTKLLFLPSTGEIF